MTLATESYYIFVRYLKKMLRMPPMLFFALFQPLIWLLLFSQLFKRMADLPGFPAKNYLDFFVPGVILMTALFSGGQSGMTLVMDLTSGYLEKMLITPIHRSAILIGKVGADAVRMALQACVILGIAYIMGVRYASGVGGILVILFLLVLFGLGMAGFSLAVALLTKNSETQMMLVVFVNMPMMFLSTAMMPKNMLPSWMETAASLNPVSYGVDSIRSLVLTGYDWTSIGLSAVVLASVAAVTLSVATLLFRRVAE